MEHRTYYYARVSTKEQNLDRQLAAFRSLGASEREIIIDKESGKDLDRKIVCTLTLLLPQCSIMGMISKRLNSLSGYSALYFSSSFRYLDLSLLLVNSKSNRTQ